MKRIPKPARYELLYFCAKFNDWIYLNSYTVKQEALSELRDYHRSYLDLSFILWDRRLKDEVKRVIGDG